MMIDGKKINATLILNLPRLLFSANFNCILNSIVQCGFRVITGEGVYYDQTGTGAIKQVLDSEYLIFVDYDSIFNVSHVKDLLSIIVNNPNIDAIVPIQVSRHNHQILCYDPNVDYKQPLAKIKCGHFGLTAVRSTVFSKISKPWFHAQPNDKGEWEDGKIDADISFWLNCAEHGINVYSANTVCIGHMDLFTKWPCGMDRITVQQINQYSKEGVPADTHFGIPPANPNKFDIKM